MTTPAPPAPDRLDRDRLVGLLLLVHRAVAHDLKEPEFVAAAVEISGVDGWLGALLAGPAAAGLLAGLPHWLTVQPDSALAVLVDRHCSAAPDPPDGAGAPRPADRAQRLLDVLDDRTLDQLANLWASCPARGQAPGGAPGPAPSRAAVLDTAAGRVAVVLIDGAEPDGGWPGWITTQSWAAPHLAAAHRAVRVLASEFRVPVPPAEQPLPVAALPALLPADDPTIGLGYALDLLAGVAGLPLPHHLVVGELGEGQAVVPIAATELDERLAELRRIGGTDVLALTPQGWVRTDIPDGKPRSLAVPAAPTVDGAAAAVWGDRWAAWKRERHVDELRRLGWVPEPLEPRPDDVWVSQAGTLRIVFQGGIPEPRQPARPGEAPRSGDRRTAGRARRVAAIGGPVRSGKTTIARLLAADLRGKGWQVLAIRSVRGELPDRDPLIEACRRATALLDRDENKPCLLVVDGLLPLRSDALAVDALLPVVSERVGVSVLAVLEYDLTTGVEWRTDTIEITPAVVGRPQLRAFVERVCAARPGELDSDAGLAELNRSDGTRDLGVLLRVMQNGGGHDPVLACLAELGAAEREAVARAAAASLIRSGVARDTLAFLTDDQVATLDVQAARGGDTVALSSLEDSTRILQRVLQLEEDPAEPDLVPLPGDPRVQEFAVDLLRPRVDALIRENPGDLLPFLVGAQLYRTRVAADLLDHVRGAGLLHTWLTRARAADLARCLIDLDTALGEETVRSVVRQLTRRLTDDSSPLRIHDLTTTLHGLRHAISTGTLALSQVRGWVRRQVSAVLAAEDGTAQERLHLLERTEWFQDPDLDELVVKDVATVVTGLDPRRAADYFLVLRALRLQRRLWRRVADDDLVHYDDAAGYHPVDREPGAELLIEYRADTTDRFDVVLANMMLRRRVEQTEWTPMIDEYQHLFSPALDNTSPRDVIAALQELRRTSGMHRNEILKRAVNGRDQGRFLGALRDLLRRATPVEVAELLQVVHGLHAWCACLLLRTWAVGRHWGPEDAPDGEFVASLATATRKDPKAAGMLLSVTHAIEDPYHQTGESFAQRFGDALGEETIAGWLRNDPRPSVKYHLVKGLWDADVAFRERCLRLVVDIVAESLTVSRRAWAPRLALRIGTDAKFGPGFLDDLRARVDVEDLMAGMSEWAPPDAQAEFHRLTRALYPNAAVRFARTFDVKGLAHRLANAPTVPAGEACREIARTMRYASGRTSGVISGAALLQKTGRLIGRPDVWVDRLDTAKTGEEFTQVLRILSHVDRGFVRRMLVEFGERTIHTPHSAEELRLVWKARSAVYQNPLAAAGLLAALEEVAELGEAVYERLADDAGLMKIFTDELQLMQNPSEQYAAALHLARIGVGPRRPLHADWTEQTYTLKKQIIATMSSPRSIRDVVRTVALWERRWALELLPKIDHAKVGRRLRLGLTGDLGPAVELAGLLAGLDDDGGASTVLDVLDERGWARVVEYLDLRSTVLLLRVVGLVRPHQEAVIAEEVNARIVATLRREIVLDDRAMWRDVGHAAHALAEAGFPLHGVGRPPVREPLLADAAPVSRALSWFPPTPWRRRHQTDAVERLITHPPRSPGDLALALAGASAAGRLDDLLAVVDDLSPLAGAGTRDLADLVEFARSRPDLADVLRPHHDDVEARLTAPTSVGSLDAVRLEHGLVALATPMFDSAV